MDINQSYREAVKTIKEAILRSQYRAAVSVNKEQLSLYYGIGRYVSENSRTGFWGKGAVFAGNSSKKDREANVRKN